MVIDTERVRRHLRAALASLPLLACEPNGRPDADTTQRTAPALGATMAPLATEDLRIEVPRSRSVAVVLPAEDAVRRALEVRHAERLKHPPRPVSGRPLRVDGRDVVACLRRVDVAGVEPSLGLELSPEARAEVAAQWMRDARHEHASIASFQRAHAELEAHGAPPSLLLAIQRAGRDETVHTSLCLAMAWRYGAPRLAPGPLDVPPARAGTLADLAADVFEEGAVNETFAATVAATGARRCEVGDARRLLGRISDDESGHAAIAWVTLSWAMANDPDARLAVAERAAALRPSPRRRSGAPLGALGAHGRLDADDLERAYAATWFELVEPLLGQDAAAA